jgi:hypothetical protein
MGKRWRYITEIESIIHMEFDLMRLEKLDDNHVIMSSCHHVIMSSCHHVIKIFNERFMQYWMVQAQSNPEKSTKKESSEETTMIAKVRNKNIFAYLQEHISRWLYRFINQDSAISVCNRDVSPGPGEYIWSWCNDGHSQEPLKLSLDNTAALLSRV